MGHYYDTDGNPCHQVTSKNGSLRDTIVTDARKLGLVPSVSTLKETGVQFGLLTWMHNLLLDCAASNPYHSDGSDVDEWKKTVLKQYEKIRVIPQNRGSEIHDKLEKYYKTGEICSKDEQYLTPTIEFISKEFGSDVQWIAEESFCCRAEGFGGCVDLHSKKHNIIIDFKTKDKEKLSKSMQYDDHRMQLAAYQIGLNMPEDTKRYNLFISTIVNTPGQCLLVEAKEFDKSLKMFYALRDYWIIKNNYDPRIV